MRKRLFHFGSQEHRFPRVLFSFNFLQFRWFDMSSRSFRFLYSNFHARSNLSSLFERRETHRVAPKRLSVSVSSELLFSRGGENDHEGSFQSRVKLTLYSKLFETCSKIDLKIRPKVGRLAISSFHYRSMRRLDTFRGVSTTRTFHSLNLKRRVCILFRVYIIIVAWKMFANISRNETGNEQRTDESKIDAWQPFDRGNNRLD